MNVYIVEASDFWYDEFDSVVVVAESEYRAIDIASNEDRKIESRDGEVISVGKHFQYNQYPLTAKKIDLSEEGIVHESFNAG